MDEISHRDGDLDTALTIGTVAEMVGVSVRTLHHWDHLDLVVPSERSHAGYRLYTAADIARLQQVLVYRELGFPLARIRPLIDDPQVDAIAHLVSQRGLLRERIAHLQRMLRAVDTMIERHDMTSPLTPEQQARAMGIEWTAESADYAAEAEQRWGDTDDWAEAERIKAAMSAEDFARAKQEIDDIDRRLVQAMRDGVSPGSAAANALAEEHRTDSVGRWFTVTASKHVLIARGFTEDPRFRAHYEQMAPGFAAWLRAVIEANAATHGVDPESVRWQ